MIKTHWPISGTCSGLENAFSSSILADPADPMPDPRHPDQNNSTDLEPTGAVHSDPVPWIDDDRVIPSPVSGGVLWGGFAETT